MYAAAVSSNDLTAQIEALRQQLAEMKLNDMPLARAQTIGDEIAAIRAQLKRLKADRVRLEEAARRALNG